MGVKKGSTWLIIAAIFFVAITIFIFVPVLFLITSDIQIGNVARIPIEGVITSTGGSYLGSATVSSVDIVKFIEEASEDSSISVILLEINSPGGSAVASDEIAAAVKKTQKPTIALIREAGASGGYWIASASDHIVANRMSITGSIGVISSYLEFSGLFEEHGVGYERLIGGKYKDLGTPFKKLSSEEKSILQKKIDTIHDYFIEEVALNRNLDKQRVKNVATGEFYLGVEAFNLGLVDELGDIHAAEEYMKKKYSIDDVSYVTYQKKGTFLDAFSGVMSEAFYSMGQGMSSSLNSDLSIQAR